MDVEKKLYELRLLFEIFSQIRSKGGKVSEKLVTDLRTKLGDVLRFLSHSHATDNLIQSDLLFLARSYGGFGLMPFMEFLGQSLPFLLHKKEFELLEFDHEFWAPYVFDISQRQLLWKQMMDELFKDLTRIGITNDISKMHVGHVLAQYDRTQKINLLFHGLNHIRRNLLKSLAPISEEGFHSVLRLNLSIARFLALELDKLEYFYTGSFVFIDYLNQLGQLFEANVLANDLDRAATLDNCPEFGSYCLMRNYVHQSHFPLATVSALATTAHFFNKTKASRQLFRMFSITCMHYFQKINQVYSGVSEYCNALLDELENSTLFDADTIYPIYFNKLYFSRREPSEIPPEEIIKFIENYRYLLNKDSSYRIPGVLSLVYYVTSRNQDSGAITQLESLRKELESKVDPRVVKKLTTKTSTSLDGVKEKIISKLILIDKLITYSTIESYQASLDLDGYRLVYMSYNENDIDGYYLGQKIRSDFTLAKTSGPIGILEMFGENFYFDYAHNFKRECKLLDSDLIVMLSNFNANEIAYSYFNNNGFSQIKIISHWDWRTVFEFNFSGFQDFQFDDWYKKPGDDRWHEYSTADQEEDFKKVFDRVKFALLKIENAERVFFIADKDVIQFPHNLYVEPDTFVSSSHSTCNLISQDWYLKNRNPKVIDFQNKKIWIPTEMGNTSINLLYSKLEASIRDNAIQATFSVLPKFDMDGDINIFCAHGSWNIAHQPAVSPGNDLPFLYLSELSTKGVIAVFLICHSGSVKKDFLLNSTSSLMRDFLDKGYQAIIAPYWTLHVNVAEVWLQTFISDFSTGSYITDSVFQANKAVSLKYANPGAWACMHLFGNPYLRTKS